MAPSLSQLSNTSSNGQAGGGIGLGVSNSFMGASPANLLSFASPAGLTGLDMGTPGGMLGVDGGQAMNLSLSDLGISSSRRGNEDEERRVKLEGVLAKIQGRRTGRNEDARKVERFGRLSEEGVRRVGCWVGMDIDVENEKKQQVFEGNRQVVVAGKSAVLIDVSMPDSATLWKHEKPNRGDGCADVEYSLHSRTTYRPASTFRSLVKTKQSWPTKKQLPKSSSPT